MVQRSIIICLLATAALFAQRAHVPGDTEGFLDSGIDAYRSGDFRKAIEAFQVAIDFDPNDVRAHLYLASANMVLYVPGSASEGNRAHADTARTEFKRVLELNPGNPNALMSLGTLSLREAGDTDHPDLAKLDDAHSWFQKVLDGEPENKNALYTIAVIDWRKVNPSLPPGQPGPLTDAALRHSLQAQYGPMVEEGIADLKKALALDPAFDSAMSYLNLLLRGRAALAESQTQYQEDIEEAGQWVQKMADMRTARTQAGAMRPAKRSVGAAAAQPFTKVDPAYPPLARQAKIQGTVRFRATIGKDGSVVNLELISGHPLLVAAAKAAAKQWTYKPTLLNGQPVEVVTSIDVNFSLNK
jgi:TonB family protein